MAPEPKVSSRDVLDALLYMRHLGQKRSLQRFEQTEPELASYAIETLSQIHRHILNLGGPAAQSQKTYMKIQSLLLVSIFAMQRCDREPIDID